MGLRHDGPETRRSNSNLVVVTLVFVAVLFTTAVAVAFANVAVVTLAFVAVLYLIDLVTIVVLRVVFHITIIAVVLGGLIIDIIDIDFGIAHDQVFSLAMDAPIEGVSANKLTVAFAIENGGSDIQMPIQVDVVDFNQQGQRQVSQATQMNFLNCATTLIDLITQQK